MRLSVYGDMLDLHEVNVSSVDKRGIFGPYGRWQGYRESWAIRGVVRAAGMDAVQTKYEARELTFGTGANYTGDVILYRDDGTTVAQRMLAAGTRYGVRIKSFRWISEPFSPHATFVNYRGFYALFEAEYPSADQSSIYMWKETIRQIGLGGRDFEILESLGGTPIDQTTKLYTSYMFQQYGAAIGLLSHPTVPSPIFPLCLKTKQSSISASTAEWPGLVTNMLFPATWQYLMHSTTPAALGIQTYLNTP